MKTEGSRHRKWDKSQWKLVELVRAYDEKRIALHGKKDDGNVSTREAEERKA